MDNNPFKIFYTQNAKLLGWDKQINFNFTDKKNVKSVLNNFLNWLKVICD